MKKKSKMSAEKVVDFFAEHVQERFVENKVYQRIVCIDDDMFSAYAAAERYCYLKSRGQNPIIDCVGGCGTMSRFINPKKDGKRLSEAEYLQYTLLRLGIPEKDIGVVVSGGTNSGENLSYYVAELIARFSEDNTLLFCPTKRFVGRLYLTQICQQPQLKADYYWVDYQDDCQLYNGKGFAGGLPWLSEVASIYDRYMRYGVERKPKAYMALLPCPLPEEIMQAGEYLCQNYLLKIPCFSARKLWQYMRTYFSYIFHRSLSLIEGDYYDHLVKWDHCLTEKYRI